MAPCVECGALSQVPIRGLAHVICDSCHEKRRQEGRNRVERLCSGCQRLLYYEARETPSEFCAICREFGDSPKEGVIDRAFKDKSGDPVLYVATRDIFLDRDTRILSGTRVVFDGVVLDTHGHRVRAPELNEVIRSGGLKPRKLRDRFERL